MDSTDKKDLQPVNSFVVKIDGKVKSEQAIIQPKFNPGTVCSLIAGSYRKLGIFNQTSLGFYGGNFTLLSTT